MVYGRQCDTDDRADPSDIARCGQRDRAQGGAHATVELRDLRSLLNGRAHHALAAGELDEYVVQLVAELQALIGERLRLPIDGARDVVVGNANTLLGTFISASGPGRLAQLGRLALCGGTVKRLQLLVRCLDTFHQLARPRLTRVDRLLMGQSGEAIRLRLRGCGRGHLGLGGLLRGAGSGGVRRHDPLAGLLRHGGSFAAGRRDGRLCLDLARRGLAHRGAGIDHLPASRAQPLQGRLRRIRSADEAIGVEDELALDLEGGRGHQLTALRPSLRAPRLPSIEGRGTARA